MDTKQNETPLKKKNQTHFSFSKKKKTLKTNNPLQTKKTNPFEKKHETIFQKIQNIKTKKNLQNTNKPFGKNKTFCMENVF